MLIGPKGQNRTLLIVAEQGTPDLEMRLSVLQYLKILVISKSRNDLESFHACSDSYRFIHVPIVPCRRGDIRPKHRAEQHTGLAGVTRGLVGG